MKTIIHVAKIQPTRKIEYLYLKQIEGGVFRWQETDLVANSVQEAFVLAQRTYKGVGFSPLVCGSVFSLPYRDTVGSNALFWQMALSYDSPNGQYYDPSTGSMAFVDGASNEALDIWRLCKEEE